MSLRDQFKKAKLLSDQQVRQLAHEERLARKEKGRETLERETEQRRAEVRELQQRERETVQRAQAEREHERKAREEATAVAALLAGARKPGPGTVKFYFATDDGSLPWIELTPREAQEIRAGQLCVVRSGPASTHTYRLLPSDAARRVAKVRPDAVVLAPRHLGSG